MDLCSWTHDLQIGCKTLEYMLNMHSVRKYARSSNVLCVEYVCRLQGNENAAAHEQLKMQTAANITAGQSVACKTIRGDSYVQDLKTAWHWRQN